MGKRLADKEKHKALDRRKYCGWGQADSRVVETAAQSRRRTRASPSACPCHSRLCRNAAGVPGVQRLSALSFSCGSFPSLQAHRPPVSLICDPGPAPVPPGLPFSGPGNQTPPGTPRLG